MIYDNILQTIGGTPLVTIQRLNPNPAVKILAKVEYFNPGGSIKDRVAMAMIEAAERSGELTKDKTVIEATSGNTGIGLAMVCAVKGYNILLLMSSAASEERKRIVQAYGAKIKLTPPHLSTDGAIEEAYRMAREEPDKYVLVDQYNNPASIEAHYKNTGQEIYDQTGGRVTHVVATLGTSGTAMGITKRLKELDKTISIIAVEPYAGHKIQGLKNMQESYPPGIYDKKALDEILRVEDEEAFEIARQLARQEGLLVGMSSGAAMAGALKVASRLKEGLVVVLMPDSGERYMSTTLFASKANLGPLFHNAASGKDTHLSLESKPVSLFTMGPPMDSLGDLESWRRLVLTDVLHRYLVSKSGRGVQAEALAGLADLDDRALDAARAAGMTRQAFAGQALIKVSGLARQLGLSESFNFALASESTETSLAMIRKMLARGAAYEKMRSVYFDVRRFTPYGDMDASRGMEKLSLGKTVDLQDYIKEHAQDFTLLKRCSLADLKSGECLTTEWGNVRPSWFMQLAAAAADRLPGISIFIAGEAHRFPHLENFRAIWSQSAKGLPQIWLLAQAPAANSPEAELPSITALLESGVERPALRLWLLSNSYHKNLVCSGDTMAMWRKNWTRIQRLAVELSLMQTTGSGRMAPKDEVDQLLVCLKTAFKNAMENDLSLHHFWPELFRFCRETGKLMEDGFLTPAEAGQCLAKLKSVDQVLGILDQSGLPIPRHQWPAKVSELIDRREEARKSKDFAMADELRCKVEEQGLRIEDTAKGVRLYNAD